MHPSATTRSAKPSSIGEMPGISAMTTTAGPLPLRNTRWLTPPWLNDSSANVEMSPTGAFVNVRSPPAIGRT